MHIFSKKNQEHKSELNLVQVQEKQPYDAFAAIAKALVIFLLVYGALGGFLSAFDIDYNKGVCMLILFLMALLLCSVYETGKKWLINLVSLSLFGIYIYIALSNYWVINSGYYAILNQIYEKARDYLGVLYGTEYSLMVENDYVTVTVFVLFLGMVGTILFNIQMKDKCSLLKVVLLTFTPYVIPMYLDCSPSVIYIIFLFAGYATAAVLQGGNVREHLSGQMRYVLPLTVVTAAVAVRMVSVLLPEENYSLVVPASADKVASKEQMTKLAQYGMMALFQTGTNGAGVSGGMLSRGSAVLPSYETDLIVRYTPYSYEPVYLKAFTGKDYLGTRWTDALETLQQDDPMLYSTQWRRTLYEADSSRQGRGIMEVENVGAAAEYEYSPYYTDDMCTTRSEDGVVSYSYYPDVYRRGTASELQENSYGDLVGDVDEAYLYVPEGCEKAVREVCETAGFDGTVEEIAQQVVDFFQENYSYTLRPGFYYGSSDYITHFLLKSKRGYCSHFASAGTMIFRSLGIPARYVEGYVFSYTNMVDDGTLVEGASYEDYYSGYSALGDTALVEMEIPDANAHAWVEIYVQGEGWIVVDPTPSSSDVDTSSFWDAFAEISGGSDGGLNFGESGIGAYLEKSLGGISYAVLAAAVLLLAVLSVGNIMRLQRERKLPERERVQREYRRLEQKLSGKYKEFQPLRTLGEQMDWIRANFGQKVAEEQEQALYQVFFGETVDYDCEKLRKMLVSLRRKLGRK